MLPMTKREDYTSFSKVDNSSSLEILNEAVDFIEQAKDEYRTYYSKVSGEVREVKDLISSLRSLIKR